LASRCCFRLDAGSNTPVNVDPTGPSYVGEDGGFFVSGNALIFNAFSLNAGTDQVFELDRPGSTTPTVLTNFFNREIDHTFQVPANFYEYDAAGGLFFVAHDLDGGNVDVLFLDQGG